jgi:tripartite ATP-independent transporter DctM subunit
MQRVGYPTGYAASIIGGAATIGPLIPPSISFIIYAAATEESVGRLFLGGAIPGILLGLLLMVQAYFVARKHGYPKEEKATPRQRVRATIAGGPVLLLPVIVLGSILGGIATPTEAAVLGVLAVLILGTVVYRELSFATFGREVISSARTVGSVFFIIAAAAAFGKLLTLYGAADALETWLTGLTDNPIVFLLAANVVFLLLGSMIDTVPILLVFVPLLMPTVNSLGIDPVHFGIIVTLNLAIGQQTPPVASVLVTACSVAKADIWDVTRSNISFICVLLILLLLVTYVPAIPMTLVEYFYRS